MFVLAVAVLSGILAGLTPAAVFLAIPPALGLAVGAAIYLPARNALKIDPIAALRNE